jgi:hypothetical protein
MRGAGIFLAVAGLLVATSVFGAAAVEAHHGAFAPKSLAHYVIAHNANYAIPPGGSGALTEQVPGGHIDCPVGTHLLKIEVPANGVYALSNGGEVIISNFDGTTFDWAIAPGSLHTIDANVVLVKGGPATMAYFYGTFEDDDVRLSAPLNPMNGKVYGISHIQFCFDPKAR